MPDPTLSEQEKRVVEEKAEEKRKEMPWWQRLNPIVIAGGAVVAFLIIRSMSIDSTNRNSYMFWLIALAVVIYLLSQMSVAKESEMITPREAELLVERDCERKLKWGQYPPMSKYKVGPVISLHSRDSQGIFYEVAVEFKVYHRKAEYWVATVWAKGLQKGFVTFREGIGPLTGRERIPEKTLMPELLLKARQDPLLGMIYRDRLKEK